MNVKNNRFWVNSNNNFNVQTFFCIVKLYFSQIKKLYRINPLARIDPKSQNMFIFDYYS